MPSGATRDEAVSFPMARPKKQPAPTPYKLSLELGDQTYTSEGENALAALMALPKPVKVMGKGILTVQKGDMQKKVLMYPVRLKRLFYNKLFQEIQAKQFDIGLKKV